MTTMAKDIQVYMDTLMNEIPLPSSNTSNEIQQEGLNNNQYASETSKEIRTTSKRPFIHTFTTDGNFIADGNIVLISLRCNLYVSGVSMINAAGITLNGVSFYGSSIATTATSNQNILNEFMIIPEWLIVKGDRFDVDFNWSVGAGHSETLILLGYYLE